MEDLRLGSAIRQVRIRRGWRQLDLAAAAGISRGSISRIERGHVGSLSIEALRRVAAALEIRIDLRPLWRGGELDRLLNSNHSRLHELVARRFASLPDWIAEPEVSFRIFGERGVIDILAWHPKRRVLLVIELKTDIVDVNDLIGTIDRKRRLAKEIARSRGWDVGADVTTSVWIIVAASRTNRRRVDAHRAMVRAAFPLEGRSIGRWLREPTGPVRCLSFWPNEHPGSTRQGLTSVRRVSRPRIGGSRAGRARAVA